MKLRLLVAALALALPAPALAATPPRVDAAAYLVENASTREVVAGRAAGKPLPIASLTKMMTVLLALERVRPDDVVTVGARAAAVGESSIELRPGDRLTVRDLIKASLIQSANNAAEALAEYVSRGDVPAFVALMNRRARELGLTDTHFVRPDGLDAPGHVSSARDVTRLAEILMHKTEARTIVRERDDTIAGGRRLHTWNDLLGRFPGLIGVKTGHTAAAGWCEVAAARATGFTIYATILGSPNRDRRNRDLAALLRFGLSQYRVETVIGARGPYAHAALGYGRAPLALVAAAPLRHVVRIGRPLTERVVTATAVTLPVRRGQRLGEVRVYDGARLLGSRPLVASRSVERPGLAGRVGWYARRTVHHLWAFVT